MNNSLALNLPFSLLRLLILKLKINLRSLWVPGFILILAFLVFYIFQISKIISESYLLQSHQQKLNELSLENETLSISSAHLNSLGSIEERVKEFGFEKIDKVYFIRIGQEYAIGGNKPLEESQITKE